MQQRNLGHAIVVGGSMAGLLAARALSQHFSSVSVIDRDTLPDRPDVRKGVPQARHLHTFWAGGLQAMERLLPDLQAELVKSGAVECALPTDVAWLTPAGRWTRPFAPTQRAISASRALLEHTVRRHVASSAAIRVLTQHDVTGLRLDDAGEVRGVSLRDRASGHAFELAAELVVDASGRGSKLPQWLSAHGLPTPSESVVDSFLGYASRLYEIPTGLEASWKALYIQNAPPQHPRGGIMFPIEGGRWIVTLIGGARDYPPTDEEGFLEFAASLRSPAIHDTIRTARSMSPIWGYRRTANRWRHYEKIDLPGRLLVIGDSLCAFNPVYGQGMTVAAKEAVLLTQLLQRCDSSTDLSETLRGAQRAIAATVTGPWLMSTGSDLRYPTTVGSRRTLASRVANAYLDRVLAAVTDDVEVNAAFLRVLNMLDEPQSLFRPQLARRVLLSRRQAPAPEPVTRRESPVPVC